MAMYYFFILSNNRPFCSPAMVNRVAGMLNYFLVRLVSKKQMGAFKVIIGTMYPFGIYIRYVVGIYSVSSVIIETYSFGILRFHSCDFLLEIPISRWWSGKIKLD